jgi:dTDP-4-amino-4,6-dideoxygalactose transaminase
MDSRNGGSAIVPFNRLETSSRDFVAAFSCFWHSDPLAALREMLQEMTGQRPVILAPSGESAIAQVLLSLPQQEVVMPAYLCGEVRRAALIAGKRVIYVDLAKHSVNATSAEFAREAQPGRILLAVHAYGVPTDIEAICELAKSRGCVTIEDAVPAFGGRRNGRLLGTFGDFGIFSFQHSKRVPALRGAAIVVNNSQIVDPVKLAAIKVTETKRAFPIGVLCFAVTQNLATTPWVYRSLLLPLLPMRDLPRRLMRKIHPPPARPHADAPVPNPGAQAGSNPQKPLPRTPYYTREMHPYQAELALRVLGRWNEIREQIARLADTYLEVFRDTAIETFLPPGCDPAGLMRFPIALPGKHQEQVLELARRRGLYLKVIWDRPLPAESEYPRFPNAVWTTQNLVLLPLYRTLSPESAAQLAENVVEIERE